MEKKSMGSFLAALRKARGYTQKELAEQLGVSDKSISRWERDEGAPDLSMIPVLAEFFGVTADELLRGERRAEEDHNVSAVTSPKGEKQRQRLVNAALTKYHNQTLISGGLAGVGFLAALAGNFAFLKAAPGFFAGLVFLLLAALLQGVWVNRALLTVSDEEFAGEERVNFRRRVFRKAAGLWTLVLTLFAATLPLMTQLYDPAHTGLKGSEFLLSGLVFAGIALALCGVAAAVLDRKFHLFSQPGSEERMTTNMKLQKQCALILLVAVALTFLAEMGLTHGLNVGRMADSWEFEDYNSFVSYMEQEVDWYGNPEKKSPDTESTYDDKNDHEISEEQALRTELRDREGKLLCSYLARNRSVAEVYYGSEGNGYLPIRVVTNTQMSAAMKRGNQLVMLFGLLYAAEVVTVLAVYMRRRVR